jgi:ubiquitin-like modifier-activating enzyme ATG7
VEGRWKESRDLGVTTATISLHQQTLAAILFVVITSLTHPTQSLTDRTLDQMCTVTRPGIASIAAATAVELLASLLQHPDGFVVCSSTFLSPLMQCDFRIYAPAPLPSTHHDLPDPSTSSSVLGLVPHQLRGFLAQFKNVHITGAAYSRCTGCSETVRVNEKFLTAPY